MQFTNDTLKFKGAFKAIVIEGDRAQKLFDVEKAIIGAAGISSVVGDAWGFLRGHKRKKPPTEDTHFLALLQGGLIVKSEDLVNWLEVDEPYYAIGSGRDFAIGSMLAGSGPEEAVLHASKYDIYTGMGVAKFML